VKSNGGSFSGPSYMIFQDMHNAFTGWLVMRNRLPTKKRMMNWGSVGDIPLVFFCRNGIENKDHLFFNCPFSKRIWKLVMGLCLISSPKTKLDDLVEWGINNLAGKGGARKKNLGWANCKKKKFLTALIA
jgi:hypothetical protein